MKRHIVVPPRPSKPGRVPAGSAAQDIQTRDPIAWRTPNKTDGPANAHRKAGWTGWDRHGADQGLVPVSRGWRVLAWSGHVNRLEILHVVYWSERWALDGVSVSVWRVLRESAGPC